MIVVPFLPVHLSFRPQKEQCAMFALMPEYLDYYDNGDAFTGIVNGEPIGCAGFIDTPIGSMVWAVLSDEARNHMTAITKAVKKEIATRGKLTALVRDGFQEGLRWAGMLGFKDSGKVYKDMNDMDCKLFVRENGSR